MPKRRSAYSPDPPPVAKRRQGYFVEESLHSEEGPWVRVRHNGSKVYLCVLGDCASKSPDERKEFTRTGDFNRHKKSHKGRPYQCSDCEQSFTQMSGFLVHNNVHTGAQPYICKYEECSRRFGDPSSRTRHEKEQHKHIHPYWCPIRACSFKNKRRANFVNHLKQKHRVNGSKLDVEVFYGQEPARHPPSFVKELFQLNAMPGDYPIPEKKRPTKISKAKRETTYANTHQLKLPVVPSVPEPSDHLWNLQGPDGPSYYDSEPWDRPDVDDLTQAFGDSLCFTFPGTVSPSPYLNTHYNPPTHHEMSSNAMPYATHSFSYMAEPNWQGSQATRAHLECMQTEVKSNHPVICSTRFFPPFVCRLQKPYHIPFVLQGVEPFNG